MNARPSIHLPPIRLVDIAGKAVIPGGGKKMLLSLFREATCPFCNFRVYDLSNNYPGLSKLGLDIVVVFRSSREDVLQYIARRPRPFRMVADPDGKAQEAFFVKPSTSGKMKAMVFRLPALLRGMAMVGPPAMVTSNAMTADFLLNESGALVQAYYGRDIGDHIPMQRVIQFASAQPVRASTMPGRLPC